MSKDVKTKWIYEGGMYFPISGDFVLHPTPGPGIWRVAKSPKPMDPRLGVEKLADKFEFDYKIYKLGHEAISNRVKELWNNDAYIETGKNLGVVFNGLKGTGKTIAAKLLCNELKIPTIIVDNSFEGAILPFMQSINYECVVFIDEAEKIFNMNSDDGRILLSLIDGVYNSSRKLFILTTNTLSINENLIGRPGRIRYVQEFRNLPIPSVIEYAKDNLKDESKIDQVLQEVDLLEISTIDILKAIVEEINIFGSISPEISMNIPKAKYIFEIAMFNGCDKDDKQDLENFIKKTKKAEQTTDDWYNSFIEVDKIPQEILVRVSNNSDFSEHVVMLEKEKLEKPKNKKTSMKEEGASLQLPAGTLYKEALNTLKEDLAKKSQEAESDEEAETKDENKVAAIRISDLLETYLEHCEWSSTYRMTSSFSNLWKDCETSLGTIIEPPGTCGVFLYSTRYEKTETLGLILKQKNNPSLYRGGLVF